MTTATTTPGEVDLAFKLLENTCTQVQTVEGLGRAVVATRCVETIGETILREKPALVWPRDDQRAYIAAFLASSKELQMLILDMFHPPLSNSNVAVFGMNAVLLATQFPGMQVDRIHKLLAIAHTNAHEYNGFADTQYVEMTTTTSTSSVRGATKSALFAYGSKVAHSCLPNTAYTSKTADGCLEYKLIRPVQEGDVIAFSYMEKLFQTPTQERRKMLMQSKDFLCKCTRCVGPDDCRLLPCPTKRNCSQYVTCRHKAADNDDGQEDGVVWTCPACGIIENSLMQPAYDAEFSFASELQMLERMAFINLSPQSEILASDFVRRATKKLSPWHHLTLNGLEHHTRMLASLAHDDEAMATMMFGGDSSAMMRMKMKNISKLRLKALMTNLRMIAACEAIAASCSSCDEHSTAGVASSDGEKQQEHPLLPPVYECVTESFHACQDLIRVEKTDWPSTVVLKHLQRYIPLMKICFGSEDSDVKEIEVKIASATSAVTGAQENCVTSATIAPAKITTQINQKKRSKKKKKGRGRK